MCVFAEFYGFTPSEFRALSLTDFNALAEHRNRIIKAQEKAMKRARR